jgi:hypothetical protein
MFIVFGDAVVTPPVGPRQGDDDEGEQAIVLMILGGRHAGSPRPGAPNRPT